MSITPTHHQNCAHQRHGGRIESEGDYCTYVTGLEKKTSMTDGPRFGNMQNAFKREEMHEEIDEKEFETTGRFGKAKHMGRFENKGRRHNTCGEAESEIAEFNERKQEFLIRN